MCAKQFSWRFFWIEVEQWQGYRPKCLTLLIVDFIGGQTTGANGVDHNIRKKEQSSTATMS